MSQFTSLLRQVAKKSKHPNALLYGIQLERAKQKYLVRGELAPGEAALELKAPQVTRKDGEKRSGESGHSVTDAVKDGQVKINSSDGIERREGMAGGGRDEEHRDVRANLEDSQAEEDGSPMNDGADVQQNRPS